VGVLAVYAGDSLLEKPCSYAWMF